MDLSVFNNKTTPSFSLKGKLLVARLLNVIDGDSILCAIPVFDSVYKFNVRLYGIDTMEIRSKSVEVRQNALEAKQFLLDTLCPSTSIDVFTATGGTIRDYLDRKIVLVTLECFDFDKYGRLLCNVYTLNENINISSHMIEHKFAYEYTGGTKKNYTEYL